jgi:hypothetical protein
MTVRYEYKSACCGHEYVEQRGADEPMFFPTCNACGNDDYEIVNQIVIADDIEVSPAPELVIIDNSTQEIAAPTE